MKKSFVTLVLASLFAAGAMFAAEKTESKVAKCCAAAAKEGHACTHACCVEAAKAGKNCTKCGGSGDIVKKTDAKK